MKPLPSFKHMSTQSSRNASQVALVTCIVLNDEVLLKLISFTDFAVIAIHSVVSSLCLYQLLCPESHKPSSRIETSSNKSQQSSSKDWCHPLQESHIFTIFISYKLGSSIYSHLCVLVNGFLQNLEECFLFNCYQQKMKNDIEQFVVESKSSSNRVVFYVKGQRTIVGI